MFKKTPLWAGLCLCLCTTSVLSADLGAWVADMLAANPEIRSAQAAVEAARGRSRASDQPLFNPELEIDYENTDIHTYSGGLSQTLDWSGKREARSRVAGFERTGAELELLRKRQQLASALLSGLAAYAAADELQQISLTRSKLMQRFADLAQRRRDAGDLDQVELDLARLAAAQAKLEQANARVQAIDAYQSLVAITGPLETELPSLPAQIPELDDRFLDRETLLDELPEMRVARARMDAARSRIEVTRLDRKPDPTVGFRIGREDQETLAGLRFSVPLYVRNTYSAEVEVANAEWIQAQRQAENFRRQRVALLDATAQRYQLLRSAWSQWQQTGKTSLEQQTALLERLWKAGELSTTDYLVQLQQSLDTRATAVAQYGQMWQAWSDWLQASGQIEQWLNIAGEQR